MMPPNARICAWPRSGSAVAGGRVSMIGLRAAAEAIRAAGAPLSARSPGAVTWAAPSAASAAACTAVRAVATAIACTPIKTMKITPKNKTAAARASPRVPARPLTSRDRLTADALAPAKTSHTGERSQPG